MKTNVDNPVWISVKDVQHYFGIGKTLCYELMNEHLIESKLLKKRGGKQGKRLVNFESVSDYIKQLPTSDETANIAA